MKYLIPDTRPLEWPVFEKFLRNMTFLIQQQHGPQQRIYASLQTAIALAGHLGLGMLELSAATWRQVKGKRVYTFVIERHRGRLPIDADLRATIDANYDILQPSLDQSVCKEAYFPDNTTMYPSLFSKYLEQLFTQLQINVPHPSIVTLRRTYARKRWLVDFEGSPHAFKKLAVELKMTESATRAFVTLDIL